MQYIQKTSVKESSSRRTNLQFEQAVMSGEAAAVVVGNFWTFSGQVLQNWSFDTGACTRKSRFVSSAAVTPFHLVRTAELPHGIGTYDGA